jgi:hypothetical protein
MENPKNQLASKLKDANNVLVTVSTNPTVDQLSAAIGLTLFLTKVKKHATTVFSGQVPSTIDFLRPEETIETNTDSLRDFIISLDKNKADKIRYKVEDTMVKIFITPYRTSIGDQDLVFSQGDFNVDVVIAIGIHNKEDIDQAIMAHGRILHDATVATLNTKDGSDIGTLNWVDAQASSLCEMAVALTDLLKANSLDNQIATAFLTGIVAETERFSNDKTTSNTMNASAKLMAAGANQQLVATKLEPPEEEQPPTLQPPEGPKDGGEAPKDVSIDDDGALRIDHESAPPEPPEPQKPEPGTPPSDMLPEPVMPEPETEPEPAPVSQVKIDDEGQLQVEEPHIKQEHRPFLDKPAVSQQNDDMFGLPSGGASADTEDVPAGAKLVTEPPKFGGQLSAAADDSSSSASPLNLPPVSTPILSHDSGSAKKSKKKEKSRQKNRDNPPKPPRADGPGASAPPSLPPPPPPVEPARPVLSTPSRPPTGQPYVDMADKTLNDIEEKLDSPHQDNHTKLPKQFVKTLDTSTLSGLEEKVSSPHLQPQPQTPSPQEPVDYHKVAAEQVAKAVSDKTLNEIEEQVDSPHTEGSSAQVLPAAEPKKDEVSGLNYEPIASEPPDTSAPVSDDTGASDTSDDTQAPTTTTDTSATDDTSLTASTDDDSAQAKEDKEKPEEALQTDADQARDAVVQAINTGGDGRTSLPPLEAIGTAGEVQVGHNGANGTAPPAAPPPLSTEPQRQVPSPYIDIDDKGNMTFDDKAGLDFPQNLVPGADGLPKDLTAAPSDDASAPPVPPPMMPPLPQEEQ